MKLIIRKIVGLLVISQLIHAAAVFAAQSPANIPPPPSANPPRFNSDLYRVEKQLVESNGRVGENVRYRIRLEALGDVEQVRILETIPAGVVFVDAQPAPTEHNGNARLWVFSKMTHGESKEIIITVSPATAGWFVTDTKVAVVPVLSLPIFAGEAKLELDKTGPAIAELNDDVTYELVVRNVGTATASNVIVTDTLPVGLYGPDRSSNVVTHRIGDLPAGESLAIKVPVKAAVKGEWDNRANAYSTHLVQADAVAHVSIVESKLSLNKTGPSQAFIFSETTYTITGRNDGDTVLRNIDLVDDIPAGAQFISASDGGEVRGKQVVWTLPDLAPGQHFSRTVTITAPAPGVTHSTATATLYTGRRLTASVDTTWEGAPGVLTEISDDVDPVRVGGRVVYTIKITNQSPMRSLDSSATLVFADMLRVAGVSKGVDATVEGQRMIIKNIKLKPKASITFKVTTEATVPGMGGVRFEFGSGFLPRPVVKEETTYIY